MDLATTMESIAAQGAMFWAATGSVTLGGTLILVAIGAHFRRLKNRRMQGRLPEPVAGPVQEAKPSPEVNRERNPALTETHTESPVQQEEMTDNRELRLLAARLRSASDKLDQFRRKNGSKPALTEESSLKEPVSPVDYVFRAGLG